MSTRELPFSSTLREVARILSYPAHGGIRSSVPNDAWYQEWAKRNRLDGGIRTGDGADFRYIEVFVRRGGLVFEFYHDSWLVYLVRPQNTRLRIRSDLNDEGTKEITLVPEQRLLDVFRSPVEIRIGGRSGANNDPSAPWWADVEAEVPSLFHAAQELKDRFTFLHEQKELLAQTAAERRQREDREWYNRRRWD